MIWIIIVIAGLLIYFTMNNLKDESATPSPIKGSPDNGNLILAQKKGVITDFNEQMLINLVAGMLENLATDRKQTVHYKADKELQDLLTSFHLDLHRIAIDKITNESIREKYYVDKEVYGGLVIRLIQHCSNLVNQKSSFIEIREGLEDWVVQVYSEAKSQIEVSENVQGNSNVFPQVNNLADAVKIIQAEKLFNKGTELFDAGQLENALNYFEQAAQLDDKDALYQLGNAYLEGRGVDQNINKSFEYYLKSANLEHEKAQYNVGLFYLQGKLGERNMDEGLKWIKKSASHGYAEAQNVLKHLTLN